MWTDFVPLHGRVESTVSVAPLPRLVFQPPPGVLPSAYDSKSSHSLAPTQPIASDGGRATVSGSRASLGEGGLASPARGGTAPSGVVASTAGGVAASRAGDGVAGAPIVVGGGV